MATAYQTSATVGSLKGLLNRVFSSMFVSTPAEQDRIFLFLDLNNSTGLAEKLGHVRYSLFLSQFFNDFKTALRGSKGTIYQYVGDEVIVSWTAKDNHCENAVALVHAFRSILNRKAAEYNRAFGFAPEFKAAIHRGKVAVTRIGHHKAYHGDVLNTCSRMLECAARMKQQLVISAHAACDALDRRTVLMESSDFTLRGKAEPVRLFIAA